MSRGLTRMSLCPRTKKEARIAGLFYVAVDKQVGGGAAAAAIEARPALPAGGTGVNVLLGELSGDAHVKGEDQDGVQHDVQQSAESQADHRPVGLSLPPQQIVEDIGQDHHRGTEDDIPGVV